jgi:tetratricopeptide (TPR) repeat protein
MPEPVAFPAAAQVAELERRMKWRALPMLAFLVIMLGLTVVAIAPLVAPPSLLQGLPADPDVLAAQRLASARLVMPVGELRFRSALTGDVAPEPGRRVDRAVLAEVRARIESARTRSPHDARLALALAHLTLAQRTYRDAERAYRAIIDHGDRAPEAHLGLGVALAQQAQLEPDLLQSRGLTLQAIAQFAAVRPGDPAFEAALYDRALLLATVDRGAEARRFAEQYAKLDPSSPWGARLAQAVTPTSPPDR